MSNAKNIKGRTALVRMDFNVSSTSDSLRLQKSLPTLKFLVRQRTSIILISHKGEPHGEVDPQQSLKFLQPFLQKELGKKVVFFDTFDFRHIREKIRSDEPGSIFLLENLRFHPGEESNSADFAHQLASLADFYVNDAFANSHRAHASMVSLPQYLPHCAGLLLEEELNQLTGVLKRSRKPLIVILAGGKAKDKFSVIENLYAKVDHFLLGGILANSFLKAQGMHIHPSVVEGDILEEIRAHWLKKKKILLPQDFVKDSEGRVLDIGPKTIRQYLQFIKKAKSIIWGGPLGVFEDPKYHKGSIAVAKAVSQAKARSIVGGGETTSLILELGLEKKINFLSTGGGAMLKFLSGEKLPGIEAIRK
ncbi:MAG: phosphoglycerate kinase [Candidatus Harrisonbacteria bacterium]|nr:phosphoglycerate kinase [Candidatus Harrisonbacteria bacterium]